MGGFGLVLDAPYVVYTTKNQVDYKLLDALAKWWSKQGEGFLPTGLPSLVLANLVLFFFYFTSARLYLQK